MEFILVRHVETTGNFENKFSGITDVPYTERGKEQFKKLVEELKKYKVDKIYSSPLSRALNIAKKVSENSSTEVEVVPALSEMNFGIFEDHTFEEILEKHKKHWDDWQADYINYTIPEGDSLASFQKRVSDFIDTIKNDDGTCMIVCHGGTIQSIITHLLDLELLDRWHFHIPLGGIVKITYSENYGMMSALYTPVQ